MTTATITIKPYNKMHVIISDKKEKETRQKAQIMSTKISIRKNNRTIKNNKSFFSLFFMSLCVCV